MTTNNFNSIRLTTPKGYAQYPYLLEPDTKFNPEGDYKVNLAMDDNEATKKLITKLDQILDNFYEENEDVAKAQAKGRKVMKADIFEYDSEGRVVLKFKQKAVITKKDGSKFEVKIPQFDAKGKPMKANIGRDSVIKVNFSIKPYYMPTTKTVGLSLRPVAVQVIDLKEFTSGGSAESYGFGEEEGYEAEDTESTNKSTTPWNEDEQEENTGEFASNF
jgi:hypothetical protein